MVQGIETDSKYKHIKKDDEKWLTEDLKEIKKTVQNYITNIKSDNEQGVNQSVKKTNNIIRNIAIILGIFGLISIVIGIYLLITKQNYLISIPLIIFGAVFVLTYVLTEKYK